MEHALQQPCKRRVWKQQKGWSEEREVWEQEVLVKYKKKEHWVVKYETWKEVMDSPLSEEGYEI